MHSHQLWPLANDGDVRAFSEHVDLLALAPAQAEALRQLATRLQGSGSILTSAWNHGVEVLAFGPREKLGVSAWGADEHAIAADASLLRYRSAPAEPSGPLEVGGLCLPLPGEEACGDAWEVSADARHTAVCLVDGLGHGAAAAQAAGVALAAFQQHWRAEPARCLAAMHESLRGTKGVVAAIARIDREEGRLDFSGVGNISARLYRPESSKACISTPGVVGFRFPKPRQERHPWSDDSTLLMHTDGLSGGSAHELLRYPASLQAGLFYHRFGGTRDDCGVLVVRSRPEA